MANYLELLDAEIARTQSLLTDLEKARAVLTALTLPVAKEKKPKTPSKVKGLRRGRVVGEARKEVIEFLGISDTPVRGMDIMQALQVGSKYGESTVWKALKDLREEGLINWDSETRLYSRVPVNVKVAS